MRHQNVLGRRQRSRPVDQPIPDPRYGETGYPENTAHQDTHQPPDRQTARHQDQGTPRKMMDALVPPNPKLFDKATLIRRSCAVRATRSDLLLWLTNRDPQTGIEMSGNTLFFDRWHQLQR